MSEVIEDMDLTSVVRAPYSILNNVLRLGIFSKSQISYSDTSIDIVSREELGASFEIITHIKTQKRELSIQSTLMQNGTYFKIGSAELRKNLYRSFIKTSFQSTVKIVINQDGRLASKMHTFLTTQIELRQTKQTPKIYKLIQKTYTSMISAFSQIFNKLKPLIEPIFQKNINNMPDKLQRLDIIKNTCKFLHVKPSFMKINGERGKTNHQNLALEFIPETQLAVTNFFDMKVQSDKILDYMKYNFFIQLWEASLHLQKIEDTSLYQNFNLVKIKGMYKSNLKIPDAKSNKRFEPDEIYNQIHIHQPEKVNWVRLFEGGFGVIYKANISFFFVIPNSKDKKFMHERPIQKTMILKSDKSQNSKISRVEIQKMIIKTIKQKKCKYIPHFYYSEQKIANFGNYIMSDFYPLKSLDNWLKNFGEFTSLFSRVSILMSICYGLYCLHENGIIHRDLKIQNILVDTKMTTKLIDFGQSYHQTLEEYFKQRGKIGKPGFTIPYSPPQIFSGDISKLTKPTYDMFSLGFVVYEVIFGSSIFGKVEQTNLKKLFMQEAVNLSNLKQGQQSRYDSIIKQKMHLAFESMSHYGPIEILTPLLNVVERCLDSKIENRPHLEWVIIIVRQTINCLLDFYSL